MIETPTVFVLGAGASVPYGYPTGAGLRSLVLQGLKGKHELPLRCMEEEDLKRLGAECAISLEKSKKTAVDAFLEHRREFEKVGKLVMACELLDCEDEGKMFSEKEIPGDWLTYLLSGMDGPFDLFGCNAVSFITFNYDRVVEHVMFNAAKHRYGKSDEECKAVIKEIPFVHVHGSLGPLPWQDTEGRPYGGPMGPPEVKLAADQIKIVCEGAENDPEFRRAQILIHDAKRIYFLGFGYNMDNVERLHLGGCKEGARICGLTFGFSKREREDAEHLLKAQIDLEKNPVPRVSLHDGDCLQFLRNDPVRLD